MVLKRKLPTQLKDKDDNPKKVVQSAAPKEEKVEQPTVEEKPQPVAEPTAASQNETTQPAPKDTQTPTEDTSDPFADEWAMDEFEVPGMETVEAPEIEGEPAQEHQAKGEEAAPEHFGADETPFDDAEFSSFDSSNAEDFAIDVQEPEPEASKPAAPAKRPEPVKEEVQPEPEIKVEAPKIEMPTQEPDYDMPVSFADEDDVSETATSGLPWTQEQPTDTSDDEDDWQLDDTPAVSPNGSADAIGDVYGNLNDQTSPAGATPWSQGVKKVAPAALPGDETIDRQVAETGDLKRNLVVGVGVIVVVFLAYNLLFKRWDYTSEMTARWFGTLDEVSQEVPNQTAMDGQDNMGEIQPEQVVTTAEVMPEPTVIDRKPKQQKSNAEIDFVDVEKEEQNEQIVAGEDTEMPDDLSLFASLQSNIMKKREEKKREDAAKVTGETSADLTELSRVEKARRSSQLKKQVQDEMNAYLNILSETENPAERPSPIEYFKNPSKFADMRAPVHDGTGNLGNAQRGQPVIKDKKTLNELYGRNPQKLPTVPEPEFKDEKPAVRALTEFDVTLFEPERQRVRIPKGIEPRVGAIEFPALEILSLVPNKGIIAFVKGREGVLMLGESIEGWELISVYQTYAEFNNGKRKHIVTLK